MTLRQTLSLPIILILLLTTTSVLWTPAASEKILVLSFISSKSHKITYMKLVEELAARGHDITVVSSQKPLKDVPNIKEIVTYDFEKVLHDKYDMMKMKESNQQINPFMLVPDYIELCNTIYDLPEIQRLTKEQFDLIFMMPMFNDCALGIVHKIKAPVVLFAPTSVPSFLAKKLGSYFPPSFVPNIFLGYSDEMTFFQRFINFGFDILLESVLRFYYESAMTEVYRKKLNDSKIPPVREILANASLILSNGHVSISGPKPYLPDIVDVGGIHSAPAKPLPKDLEEFVTKNEKDGFIFFSMGSIIKGQMMPESKRKLFLNVFSKLKQQVIWKWESETMPDLPKNVKLSKWLPQQDLLGHPNIKMFITHCGGGGTEEAIYHGVPLIGMPFFGDQPLNAQLAKNLGFLVDLEWNDLTEETLSAAIHEILDNPKYQNNVNKLSTIFKDNPMSPLEMGVYWVEYVLRHKGAPHLRSASRKLNFLQYHSWDVIAAYLLIIITVLRILKALISLSLRCCCKSSSQKNSKKVSNSKKIN